ncbi:MAG: hypothetical protein LBD31_05530 [Treponema sp.]|nr:hypothetical protein [Treponema sp.]
MLKKPSPGGIILLFFCLSFSLRGQEASAPVEEVFIPFVSRLEAEVRNNFVRLSWRDAPSARGPVFVYRSMNPLIDVPVESLPLPVEVPYGAESYLDEAEEDGVIHYLVAASDAGNRKYTLPIPGINIISAAVAMSFPDRLSGDEGEGFPFSPAGPLLISGLRARAGEDRIIITFSGADSLKNPILYRSIRPIRNREDLLSALIVAQRVNSPFTDYPIPGIPYYYAVIYEEDLTGPLNIQAGRNAAAAPAEITQGSARIGLPGGIRTMPLPQLNIFRSPETAPRSLGPEASRAAASIERRNRGFTTEPEAVVFPEDLEKDGGGDEYQIRSTVQGPFSLREWKTAEEEFRRFLSLPRSGGHRAKARFYLGQICYFQDRPREALFELLEAREFYPAETKPWIDAVLKKLGR